MRALLASLKGDTPIAEFKAYEDQLDAVVCACEAIEAVNGGPRSFGDEASVI